jgi:hypothetical protein
METNEHQKDYKQEKFCSLSIHTPFIIDENQERVEWGERAEVVIFFQYTCHGKRRGIEEETCKRTRVPK